MLKKILHRHMWGKKNSNFRGLGKNYYSKSPIPPSPTERPTVMPNIKGMGKKRIYNGWRAFIMWWFSRLESCISRLKIRR